MNNNFENKNVSELQKFLKDRGVINSDQRKNELVELCNAANEKGIEVDPDGLLVNREEVIKKKTCNSRTVLQNPELCNGFPDLYTLPFISLNDLFMYLRPFFPVGKEQELKDWDKMELSNE